MMETGSGSGGGSMDLVRFTAQVLRGRWFMLFASVLLMGCAGGTYVFGIYSKAIKRTLGYDQTTLNLIGFFKDLGTTVGIFSGLIAEVTPNWFVLLVGASLNFVGYFMVWISVSGRISKPHIWQMCLYICIGANSQNFTLTSVMVTSVKNFPGNRGTLLGLLKGFTGLSGAVMTQLYLAIYGNNSTSLILFIAWFPAVISIFFVYAIRLIKVVGQSNVEGRVIYKYLMISAVLALFIMGITITQKQKTFSHAEYVVTSTVVCILLFIPLAVSVKEELVLWNLMKQNFMPPNILTIETPSLVDPIPLSLTTRQSAREENPKPTVSCFSDVFNPPERGEDYTILQAVLSIDMLLLIIGSFCGLGTSLTAIDNLGQIGESLGYPTLTISTFISLMSIWNYFGRVCVGLISEILLTKWRFPRTLVTTIVLLVSCIGHILIAFPMPGSIYLASVIIGFCYGAQVTLIYTVLSELFGLKYYSTLYNCGTLAMPLGSYVFNVRVAGFLYDREALKQLEVMGLGRDSVKELTCIGKQCYRLCFIILTAATFVGAVSSFVLFIRTRKFYQGDIYKKFRQETTLANTQVEASELVSPMDSDIKRKVSGM
ncbi:protein NUCLEAR FUSION DEFECTIVE 4-like [Papaver somniferum]|uniref:protein NUCLEAR FUSION DEFECTIVE 4-like n=1 Tax=Papaver somniferum TaxID=3469 RepID=UPI000E6F7BF1|nr:protein NUCLEAR FUSION DEFECTIVE 4-like [Papaver somniferum]